VNLILQSFILHIYESQEINKKQGGILRKKNPVLYIANTSYKLHPSDGLDIKNEKFIRMIIDGYTKTVFVNGSAKIKLR
jgi:hypothetical protein